MRDPKKALYVLAPLQPGDVDTLVGRRRTWDRLAALAARADAGEGIPLAGLSDDAVLALIRGTEPEKR